MNKMKYYIGFALILAVVIGIITGDILALNYLKSIFSIIIVLASIPIMGILVAFAIVCSEEINDE